MLKISGSHGSDIILGTSDADIINGGGGNDKINGGKGNDNINGGTGNDIIYGGKGDDFIFGNKGIDKLYGGAGDDQFTFNDNHENNLDYSNGGAGNDQFNFANNPINYSNIIFEDFYNNYIKSVLKYGVTSDGGSGNDYFSIYGLDKFVATAAVLDKLNINGGSGNDVFDSNTSFLIPKKNGYLFDGGDGYDVLFLSDPDFYNFGGIGDYHTYSFLLKKLGYIENEDSDSYLYDDSDIGEISNNFDGILNHIKNFEQINIYDSGSDISFTFQDKTFKDNSIMKFKIDANGAELFVDASKEKGASLKFDVYAGGYWSENSINFIQENAWNYENTVHIIGGGGNDKLRSFGIGDDTFQGNGGNDYFFGDDGNNTAIFNGKKSQYLIAEIGYNKFKIKDKIKGRDGIDTLENVNTLSFSDGDHHLVIKGLKIIGTNSAELINGGNYSDLLDGRSGNDKLRGFKGNDELTGGEGFDKLFGGKGKDIFKLSKGKGFDLIQDFKNKQDKIFVGSMKKLKLKNKGKDVFVYSGKDLLAKVKGAKGDLSKKGKFLV